MSKEHKVRQGECISSIADKYGFFPDTIWNDSANAELKQKRKDPNVLYPDDVVVVPDKQLKKESGGTEKRHQFRRKGIPEQLRIILRDEDGEPRARVAYRLTVDGRHRSGHTDDDGLLTEPIPPDAREGRLVVLDDEGTEVDEYALELGHLDPITEVTGVQQRLANLGFDCGPSDGQLGPRTRQAVESFQREYEIEADGEINDSTRQMLQDVYGS